MPYIVFARKTPRLGKSVMSFSRIGAIVFNQPASRIFKEAGIKDVLLLWDDETKQLALQKASEPDDPRAYTIRFNDKGNGASFSVKTFLDHVGIQYLRTERLQIPITIKPDQETCLEVKLPADLFEVEDSFALAAGISGATSSPGSSDG